MIAHLITAAEALAWVFVVLAVIFAAAYLAVAPTAEQRVERMTEEGLRQMARDDWDRDLIGLEPADPYSTTRAQIAALETTKDIA